MWQRIQTLWLLLAGVAMTLTLFLPIGMLTTRAVGAFDKYYFYAASLRNMHDGTTLASHWGFFVLTFILVVLSFATIFFFRNLKRQMRLCIYNILVTIGYLIYYVVLTREYLSEYAAQYDVKLWIALPIVAIILLWLAWRAMRKDDILLRTCNRIR